MPGVGYPAPGGASATPQKPKTLDELALEAFQEGRDQQGFQYLYADALVNDEAAERLPEEFRWVPSLKRPTLGVRWGIGVSYTAPKGYTGHPCPIGYVPSTQPSGNQQPGMPAGNPGAAPQPRQRGRRNAQQPGNPSSMGAPGQAAANESVVPEDPHEMLTYYTGELGETMLEALTERYSGGKYGGALVRIYESYDAEPVAENASSGAPGSMPGGPAGYGPGGYGPGAPGAPGSAPAAKSSKAKAFEPSGVAPAITMLGEGNERELVSRAESENIDFLILFDITVRSSNRDTASHTVRFRVMSLEQAKMPPPKEGESEPDKPREMFASKALNNQRTETARENDKPDPVEPEIEGFLAAIDANVATTPLPEKLTPEIALKRATFLAAQEGSNPLASLAEIRCYQEKKLLSKAQVTELFNRILGEEKAEKLLKGKGPEQRQAALARWLPRTAAK
jgi:hypothetical protein